MSMPLLFTTIKMKFNDNYNYVQSKESRQACFLIFPGRFQEYQYMYFHLPLRILSIVLLEERHPTDEKITVQKIEK
jgi:hypothetical protein